MVGGGNPRGQRPAPAERAAEEAAVRLVGTFPVDFHEKETGRQAGPCRRVPGDPRGPGNEPLRVANQGQPTAEERLREVAAGRIAESLGERLRGSTVVEKTEARLRLQHPEDRRVETRRVETARAHRADERSVRHGRVPGHEDHVHPRPERQRRDLAVEAPGARTLHLQSVAHHESGESHLRPEHAVEDLRRQNGGPVVPAVKRRHRQMPGHDRRDPGVHRRPEGREVHRIEVLPAGGHEGEPVMGIRSGTAVPGKVLGGGQRPAGLDAAQERNPELRRETWIRAEGTRPDHRARGALQDIQNRGQDQVDAHRPRLPRHDPALPFERRGIGRRRELHGRREPGAARRAHGSSPFVVGGDQHRKRRRALEGRGDLAGSLRGAREHDDPAQPAGLGHLEQRPPFPIREVPELGRRPRHQHLSHLRFEGQPRQHPARRLGGFLRAQAGRDQQHSEGPDQPGAAHSPSTPLRPSAAPRRGSCWCPFAGCPLPSSWKSW